MSVSVEARWFEDGSPPKTLIEWFQSQRLSKCEQRFDVYFSPIRDFGLKVRGGVKVELKYLLKEEPISKKSAGIEGAAQWWSKWTIPLPKPTPDDLRESNLWIPLYKTRWTLKYEITAGAAVSAVEVDDRVAEGCNIELVELRYQNAPDEMPAAWSLALESFGSEDLVHRNFELTFDEFLVAGSPLPELANNSALSYPDWLQTNPGHLERFSDGAG